MRARSVKVFAIWRAEFAKNIFCVPPIWTIIVWFKWNLYHFKVSIDHFLPKCLFCFILQWLYNFKSRYLQFSVKRFSDWNCIWRYSNIQSKYEYNLVTNDESSACFIVFNETLLLVTTQELHLMSKTIEFFAFVICKYKRHFHDYNIELKNNDSL